MIPKKIHFCWFSGEPFPEIVQECIDSWNKFMPEYDLVKWDMDRIKEIDSIWLKECLSVKKWAFAADFVRLWAVFHEGGIYLDCDVLLHGSLDEFCNEKMFIGREDVAYPTMDEGVKVFLTSHCFGAEAGHSFIKLCLDYYKDRHFITTSSENIPKTLRYDMLMMPFIQCRLAEQFGYDARISANKKQVLTNDVTIYPARVFGRCQDSFWKLGSIAEHIGSGSWREPKLGFRTMVKKEKNYTIGYKIRWRILFLIEKIFSRYNYILVEVPMKEQ